MSSQSATIKAYQLNLAEKCSSTPIQSFIQHHAYYKLVLRDFSKTLQEAAILCTLFKDGGSLVNVNLETPVNTTLLLTTSIVKNQNGDILMASVEMKDFIVFSLMYHWMDQLPRLPFLKDNQIKFANFPEHNTRMDWIGARLDIGRMHISSNVTAAEPPYSQSEPQFGTFIYDERVKVASDANSGDEMQGFSGLQFVPRVDVMVDRERMADYKADGETIIFGNAWYGDPSIQWPPSNSLRLLLISLHFGPRFQKNVNTNVSYILVKM